MNEFNLILPRRCGRGRSGRPDCGGFTLIELAAVMLILAVIALAATVNLGGRMSRQRFESAVERIGRYDARARRIAARFPEGVELRFDLYNNTLAVAAAGDRTHDIELPAPLDLGEGFEMTEVIGAKSAGSVQVVEMSRYGQADSYAVVLSDGVRTRWLLAAGLSGEIRVFDAEQELAVRETLATESRTDIAAETQ